MADNHDWSSIAERDASVCDAYKAGGSLEDIGKAHGLSAASVRKTVSRAGVKREPSVVKRGPRPSEAISPLHEKIGLRLKQMTFLLKDKSPVLQWSPQKLSAIEKGSYDFTLQELQEICKALGHTFESLFINRS